MKHSTKCESREHLHDVIWCKIAQAFPLKSSSGSAESVSTTNFTARVRCDVISKHVFRCSSDQCVNASVVCNGIADCPDGSDERVDSEPLCQASSNNTAIIIISIVVAMVTLAAVFWLASTFIDCLSHTYKYCTRCIRRLRRQNSSTLSTSPSSSSSSFDLAASVRILRARSAFAAAAAATRRGQVAVSPSTPQPHVVVVRGVPPSYSAIVLATAPYSPSSGQGQGQHSLYHHHHTPSTCCYPCCCCRPTDANTSRGHQGDVSFHVTCPAVSDGNVITSSCACSHHSPQLPVTLCSDGRHRCVPHQQPTFSFTATRCCKAASSIDGLPPSYSAVYGHYNVMQGTRPHHCASGCTTDSTSLCHMAS